MADKQATQQDSGAIERMVEAQARGERVAGVAEDRGKTQNAGLDTRTSKITHFADASDDMMADSEADAADDMMADSEADAADDEAV